MPNPTEVAIIKRDGSVFGVYTTYTAARIDAVSGGDATQNLTLYFDELQNIGGGTGVNVEEGNVNLIGRRIYSSSGLSMDLSSNVDCQCIEIISGTKGINIHNGSSQKIIIEADYIEGSNGNDGVIKSASGSNYVLRNAKIKNTYTGSSSPYSRGIYIESGSSTTDQTIELENLIIVTGTGANDYSIYRDVSTGIVVKNLGLFVKKDKNTLVSFTIGISTNFKFIISTDIT
jgi:hypothetical protein